MVTLKFVLKCDNIICSFHAEWCYYRKGVDEVEIYLQAYDGEPFDAQFSQNPISTLFDDTHRWLDI